MEARLSVAFRVGKHLWDYRRSKLWSCLIRRKKAAIFGGLLRFISLGMLYGNAITPKSPFTLFVGPAVKNN